MSRIVLKKTLTFISIISFCALAAPKTQYPESSAISAISYVMAAQEEKDHRDTLAALCDHREKPMHPLLPRTPQQIPWGLSKGRMFEELDLSYDNQLPEAACDIAHQITKIEQLLAAPDEALIPYKVPTLPLDVQIARRISIIKTALNMLNTVNKWTCIQVRFLRPILSRATFSSKELLEALGNPHERKLIRDHLQFVLWRLEKSTELEKALAQRKAQLVEIDIKARSLSEAGTPPRERSFLG